jgi:hypothetical protein
LPDGNFIGDVVPLEVARVTGTKRVFDAPMDVLLAREDLYVFSHYDMEDDTLVTHFRTVSNC